MRVPGWRTPPTSTGGCCLHATGTATASARAPSSASQSASRGRSECRRFSRASTSSAQGVDPVADLPDGLSRARARHPRRARAGALEPRDRPHPPHQRAHGREPHPLDPPQDAEREPDGGGGLRAPSGASCRTERTRYIGRCRSTSSSAPSPSSSTSPADDVRLIEGVNADEGVSWFFSFLSAGRRRTYCLYEAPSPDAIVAAAHRANVPADKSSR